MATQLFKKEDNQLISKRIYQTPITGLYYIDNALSTDDRGFFTDLADLTELQSVVKSEFAIKQLNLSQSKQNVVRGFHAEDWNKLVTITAGVAYCVIADSSKSSPTYAQSLAFMLSKDEKFLTGSLFISRGLANSICVVEGPVSYFYAVDQLYASRNKANDQAINLFDPTLAVDWPIEKEKMIISQRDVDAINLE